MRTFLKLITIALAGIFAAGMTACNNGGGDEPGTPVVLNVSPASITFDADGVAVNNTVTVIGTGWTAAVTEGQQWITISATSGADGETFTVTATATEDARSGKIKVTSSQNIMLEKTINVNQEARAEFVSEDMANSYIVNPGAKVILPVKHAYNAWNDYFGEPLSATAVLTTELLWMDTQGGISAGSAIASLSMFNPEEGENAGIRVVAGSKEGNALIALKADGNTVWSWHIWVTSYDPESENNAIPGTGGVTHILMNRNLGALNTTPGDAKSLGLGYQYGRKDPFPANDGVRQPASTAENAYVPIYGSEGEQLTTGENGTGIYYGPQIHDDQVKGISYATLNPTMFIIPFTGGGKTVRTWTSTNGSLNPNTMKMDMWGSNAAGDDLPKTVFDPCPKGYRVPHDPQIAVELKNKETGTTQLFGQGMDYGEYGYYPFNGLVEYTGVYWRESGWYGSFWFNRPGGFGGRHVAYSQDGGTLSETQSSYPAYGMPVRCEKEW